MLERRVANDGHAYTYEQFLGYYGARHMVMWNAAPHASSIVATEHVAQAPQTVRDAVQQPHATGAETPDKDAAGPAGASSHAADAEIPDKDADSSKTKSAVHVATEPVQNVLPAVGSPKQVLRLRGFGATSSLVPDAGTTEKDADGPADSPKAKSAVHAETSEEDEGAPAGASAQEGGDASLNHRGDAVLSFSAITPGMSEQGGIEQESQTQWQCPICLGDFLWPPTRGAFLQCSHRMCEDCFADAVSRTRNNRIDCPTCRWEPRSEIGAGSSSDTPPPPPSRAANTAIAEHVATEPVPNLPEEAALAGSLLSPIGILERRIDLQPRRRTIQREARDMIVRARHSEQIYRAGGVDLDTGHDLQNHFVSQDMIFRTWREYLILHARATEIIGTGVQRITGEYIPTTSDPNARGRERFDIHVYRMDGTYSRLHPGSHKDAEVYHFGSHLRRPHAALPFLQRDAKSMPQCDKLGKKEMWSLLQNSFAQYTRGYIVDITDVNPPVPWRLWFSNLGQWTDAFVGAGICTVMVTQLLNKFVFTITRCDDTTQQVFLVQHGRGRYDVDFNPALSLHRMNWP